MKRLLLCSVFQNSAWAAEKLVPDLEGKTAAFIPTASLAEEGGFADDELRLLRDLGLNVCELEVSQATAAEIESVLNRCDMIYVSGGNTFFLLQELKKKGALRLIGDLVAGGKPYIGESAGAIAASPDIWYSNPMDDPSKAPELTEYSALGLVNFYPVPHLDNPFMGDAAKDIVREYENSLDLRVLTDSQAILVCGDAVEVLQQPL